MVEFALVVPLLIFVMVGIMQFGVIYYSIGTVNNAAREGARYATVHPSKNDPTGGDPKSIQAVVKSRLGGIDRSRVVVTVAYPDLNQARESRISVTATYPVTSFLPGVRPFTVVKTSTMRIENNSDAN